MGACFVGGKDNNKTKGMDTQKQKVLQDKKAFERQNAKVVIVGAGPAGIHMYSLLLKAGWNNDNIIILEKENRTCGKSWSVTDPLSADVYDGFQPVHEIGTCYLHPEYHAIEDLFKEYDNDNIRKGIPSRGVFGTSMNETVVNRAEQEHVDFTEWALAQSEKLAVPKEFHWLHDYITGGISFFDAVLRYNRIHREIFGVQKLNHWHGFLNEPQDKYMPRINCSFLKFIENENCHALIPFFVYSQACQGYGNLDKIPAYYGLFWNTPELMNAVSDIFRLIVNKPNVIVVSKGFEHLWQQMIKKHCMNIKLNCDIKSVNRHLNVPNKKTQITYVINKQNDNDNKDNDDDDDQKEITIECDYLFIACGMKKSLKFLTDATDVETEIFSALSPYTLCSTLYESDTGPDNLHETVVEAWPNIIWKADGHLYAHRNSLKCLLGHQKYDKLVKECKIKKDRSIAYQFFDRPPNKVKDEPYLLDLLKNDLTTWGETNVKIIQQEVWDYFPIWNNDAVQKKYPWKVKKMQGKNKNTFYIGSSVCFESVLGVVEYNHELNNKFKF